MCFHPRLAGIHEQKSPVVLEPSRVANPGNLDHVVRANGLSWPQKIPEIVHEHM